MSKTAEERITDTLNEIPRLIRGDGVFIKEAIHTWLNNHPADRAAIGAELSFGWRGFGTKLATETQARHYRRVLLLAKRTIGGTTGAAYASYKQTIGNVSESQLRTQLTQIWRVAAPPVLMGNGDPVFASTFDLAAGEKPACTAAVRKGIAAIERALTDGVRAVKTNAVEQARFIKWFGPATPARIDAVATILETMYRDVHRRSIKLYYRGSLIRITTVSDDLGPPNCVNDYGYSAFDTRRDNVNFIHVFIGSLWFSHGLETTVYDGTGRNNRVARAGIIIHELSHAICKTADAQWEGRPMYWPLNCLAAATAGSDLVLNNADSYRLYCEEFFV